MGEEMIWTESSRRLFVQVASLLGVELDADEEADRIEEEKAEAEAEQPPMPADPFAGLALDANGTAIDGGGQDDVSNVEMPAAR